MNDWREHARNLATELDTAGVLDAAWRPAFEQVPRHVFVPRFYDQNGEPVTALHDPDTWLSRIYSDDSLTTQQRLVPGTTMWWPTSSSTKPSLMARMLHLLDVHEGHRVLEIGTGTGYNAALLCHRLGQDRVASIDIDAELVSQAAARLAEAGYHPYLTAGDGAGGIAARAPFNRIIATCAVPAIPPAWITQLAPEGRIVADLRGELSSALVVADKTDTDTVRGRFLDMPGYFMWLRAKVDNPLRDGGTFATVISMDAATTSATSLGPDVLDQQDLLFVLTLLVPGIASAGSVDRPGGPVHVMRGENGSWAEIRDAAGHAGRFEVRQGGTRHLWDETQAAYRRWAELGRPSRSRFGLTATPDSWHVWLDQPEHVVHRYPTS